MSLKILEELTFIDSDKIQRLNGAIESNFREKNKKHAAANIRSLAKILYMKGQYVYSLEQFERAAVLNNECELFHRELQDRLYCVEVLKMLNNSFELANEYTQIASLYKFRIEKLTSAAYYFQLAAATYEQMGNYFACHKLAWNSYECWDNKDKKNAMLNVAIRAAIKQQLHAKTIFYIEELMKINKYNNENHEYLSLCKKGYHAAKWKDDSEKICIFVKPLIDVHIKNQVEQRDIGLITKDYLFSYVKYYRKISDELINLMNQIYTDNMIRANIFYDLSSVASEVGLIDEERYLKIKAKDNQKQHYKKEKKYGKWFTYQIWKITSVYGESLFRWGMVSISLIIFFALIYSNIPVFEWIPENVKSIFVTEFNYNADQNWFTPVYFSCVTFTTLGFGDIYPIGICSQVWVVIEVIVGYMMLGGLISIFSKRVIR